MMGDMIDRDRALAIMRNQWTLHGMMRAVANMPSVDKEGLHMSEWISVTERLPGNESVLIYSKAGGVAEGKYNPNTEEWTQYRWSAKMKKDVTHWMPLPEPPKEGKDDG